MGKLVFKIPKESTDADYGVPIRIKRSIWDMVDGISRKTGKSKVSILEKMVEYAYANTVFEEE